MIISCCNCYYRFDIYGRPNLTEEKKDLMTKFEKNSKIYGGTKHKEYSSFKTTSTVMVPGNYYNIIIIIVIYHFIRKDNSLTKLILIITSFYVLQN